MCLHGLQIIKELKDIYPNLQLHAVCRIIYQH